MGTAPLVVKKRFDQIPHDANVVTELDDTVLNKIVERLANRVKVTADVPNEVLDISVDD